MTGHLASPDDAARAVTLTAIWKLMERSHQVDDAVLRMLVNGTREYALDEMRLAGQNLARHPPRPGTPLLGALCEAMDKERHRRKGRDQATEAMMVLPIINVARGENLERFKKPPGYQWSAEEKLAIYDELQLPYPPWAQEGGRR